MGNQGFKTLWIHLRRNEPIPQPRGVIAARTKPAIIEDKALNTHMRGAIRQVFELLKIMVKINCFPGIIMNWARLRPNLFAQDVVANMVVKSLAEPR